jgi:hypothetical protein
MKYNVLRESANGVLDKNTDSLEDSGSFTEYKEVWIAVVAQAVIDAMSKSSYGRDYRNKLKALEWLKGDSEDFVITCHYAGLDPEYVQLKVRNILFLNTTPFKLRNYKKELSSLETVISSLKDGEKKAGAEPNLAKRRKIDNQSGEIPCQGAAIGRLKTAYC